MSRFKHTKCLLICALFFSLVTSLFFIGGSVVLAAGVQGQSSTPLHRAKIYLAAGDYRRAGAELLTMPSKRPGQEQTRIRRKDL